MRVEAEEPGPASAHGTVPSGLGLPAPHRMPRVDHERIFVLDDRSQLLGEYVLDGECPLEYADLQRSIPLNGMKHLVSFYQGEYAFTPFRVDDLWFVLLTRGVPRIEDRGSIGSLLAAARVHIVSNLSPTLARREALLKDREKEILDRERLLAAREDRASQTELDLRLAGTKLRELDADVRAREGKLRALRDYALKMQRSFHGLRGTEAPPPGTP